MAQTKKTVSARRPTSPKRAPNTGRLAPQTAEYRHKEEALARPDVGTQPQFRKKAPPKTWRYDSSLAPALDWDGQNPAREQGEALIAQMERSIAALHKKLAQLPSTAGRGARDEGELLAELQSAEALLGKLKALSRPFLILWVCALSCLNCCASRSSAVVGLLTTAAKTNTEIA